ncbi:hypothetical protein MHYP_G00337120 [Metynnis hypsauchen]
MNTKGTAVWHVHQVNITKNPAPVIVRIAQKTLPTPGAPATSTPCVETIGVLNANPDRGASAEKNSGE